MLTVPQVRNRTKTVTRRNGWWDVKVGERLQACEKCQGLGKGGKIVKICVIEVVSTGPEPLMALTVDYNTEYHRLLDLGLPQWDADGKALSQAKYGLVEVVREGFPEMSPEEFVEMFCESQKGIAPKSAVNRIEFKYV
jgi:hypothetical protein